MTIENWKDTFWRFAVKNKSSSSGYWWSAADPEATPESVEAFIESLLEAKDEEIKGLKQQLNDNASRGKN